MFGYDDAPHGHMEIELKDVRVPASNVLLGEGRGFEIAQGRLGPGRIHHCMRLIGQAERALEKMCKRATERVAFGRPVADQGVTRERIAEARIMIDSARFMVLNAAWKMDTVGNKIAKKEIAMIKVLAPNVACQVIDWAMQVHGGGGVSDDFGLAHAYAHARTLRFADGPDEVHRNQIAKLELGEQTSVVEALSKKKSQLNTADALVLGAGIVGVSVARPSAEARARHGARRPARPRGGNLVRQRRPGAARGRLSVRLPARLRRAVPLRPEPHDRRALPPFGDSRGSRRSSGSTGTTRVRRGTRRSRICTRS